MRELGAAIMDGLMVCLLVACLVGAVGGAVLVWRVVVYGGIG